MKNISAILFDIDNTLVFGKKAKLFYNLYSRILEKTLAEELKISLEESIIIANQHRNLYKGRGEKSFETMNIGIEKWYDAILTIDPKKYLRPIPETNNILSFLKSRKLLIGAITDGPTPQAKRILRATEINEDFFDIFIGWERNKKMPKGGSKKIFQTIISQLKIHPSQAVMIGDSLESDIIPAIASGLNAIHINPYEKNTPNKKWKVIKSINYLSNIITI